MRAGKWNGAEFGYRLAYTGFARLGCLLALKFETRRQLSLRDAPRLVLPLLTSLLSSPLRAWETASHGGRIRDTALSKPPIFIVGHWRSGTTYLHNLMSRDPAFGYVTMFQGIAPQCCISGGEQMRRFLEQHLPLRRPMDNVVRYLDAPEEEEFAVAKLSPYSFYHAAAIPKSAGLLFERYALMQGVSEKVMRTWKNVYLSVLKKATYLADGKPLVLKSPVNTGRIDVLLRLFPRARFIHLVRNPYVVYPSTRRLYEKMMSLVRLEPFPDGELDKNILMFYSAMMRKFQADSRQVPPGNLVEVRFEKLEADPLGTMRQLYTELGLAWSDTLEQELLVYLDSLAAYQRNHHDLSTEDVEAVEHHWGFALDHWRYSFPSAL